MIQQEKTMKKRTKRQQRRRAEKGTALSAFLSIFIVVLTLTVCDAFFTTGLGSPRDYRAENINLSISNLDSWLYRSIGNPPLARQVTVVILSKLDCPDLGSADRALFQRAGIRMSIEASNLGVALLSNALGLLANAADGAGEDEQLLKDILSKVQRDFNNNGGQAAAQNITRLVASYFADEPFADGHTPKFPGDSYFAQSASASEVAQAILLLSLAKLENSDIEDASQWDDFCLQSLNAGLNLCPEGRTVIVEGSPAPEAIVLAAYLNLIAEDERFEDNFLTSLIRGAFFTA
jgi:hypothetical protein